MAAETRAAAAAAKTIIKTAPGRFSRVVTGVVVSAGLSDKTVKVQVGGEEWDKKLKKYFKNPETHLVHDPNNSLRTGDAVEIVSGWRTSKRKRYVVSRIIAPYGPPVDERPPVPTQAERELLHDEKRTKKAERKELRAEAALLERKVKTAAKLTEEITRAAWKMRLINRETWTGPVPTR